MLVRVAAFGLGPIHLGAGKLVDVDVAPVASLAGNGRAAGTFPDHERSLFGRRQALSRRDEEDAVGTVEGSQHGLEPAVATVEQIRGCNRDSLAQARGVDRPTTEPRLERPQQEPSVLERPARDAATLFAGLQLDD